MREPRKFSIGNLLHENVKYIIPPYQRGYDWKGDAQVRDMFVDLIGCIESSFADNLFLGSMIFDVSKEKEASSLEVIDGQQRITTLLITLMAARDYARDTLDDEGLAHSVQSYISNADALSDVAHHRLDPSSTVADVFSLMCEYSWDRSFPTSVKKDGKAVSVRRQVSRLKPIYEFCMGQIATFCAGDKAKFKALANQITKHTFVIRIDIEDRAEAFEIFERTNARGKGLEVSDLLKNFLFSKEKEYADGDSNYGDSRHKAPISARPKNRCPTARPMCHFIPHPGLTFGNGSFHRTHPTTPGLVRPKATTPHFRFA